MSAHVTSRFGLVGFDPTGSDLITSLPTMVNRFLDEIDAATTGYSSDVIARRPTAGAAGRVFLATDDRTSSPNGTLYFDNGTAWVIVPTNSYGSGLLGSRPRTTIRGQYYYATDDTTAGANGTLYINDGTAWVQVQTGAATALSSALNGYLGLSDSSVRRGKSITSAAESTSSASFTLLTTPDRVQNVALPTDGLIFVVYQAMWKESVTGTAQADIFLGSTEVQGAIAGVGSGYHVRGAIGGSGLVNSFVPLTTHGSGMGSGQGQNAYTLGFPGYATGGQALAAAHIADYPGGNYGLIPGGPCVIFANAGTYDVSVRFAASSGGSVTVENRKLWVWTLGF